MLRRFPAQGLMRCSAPMGYYLDKNGRVRRDDPKEKGLKKKERRERNRQICEQQKKGNIK